MTPRCITFHALKLAILCVLLGVNSYSTSALAQQSPALSGTVTDISGAVVPGASVVALALVAGSRTQSICDSEGGFRFQRLAPGNYAILSTAVGFAPVQENVHVGTQPLELHLTLRVAGSNTTIAVNADSIAIDTSSTSGGGTLNGRAMQSVPLNGRSFTDTLAFQPGVIPSSTGQSNAVVMAGVTSTPPSGDLDAGNLSVSGQRETANGFTVNGSNVVEDVNMGTAIVPDLDSISELKVLTNNFDAEYGNYSGGQVMVTTKSGTARMHGSAFEFARNTALDARNYFDSQRAMYDRNQFGGTLGGPVVKDKTYFFVDYQGTRMTQGVDTGLISVPSTQERDGDFSDLPAL